MESSSRFGQWLAKVGEKLNEQEWFQQLRAKWDELDSQSRTYIKAGAGGAAALFVVILSLSAIWSARKLRNELAEKSDLLHLVQSANDELRRLREATPGAGAGGRPGEQPAAPWAPFFESTAATAGVDKAALSVSPEKAGATTDLAKESLFDLQLKRVNIKQVVRYAFYLENGARPVKVRNLTIDTKADPAGYMDATLAVSAFAMKQ
jgi:hypothetical protein